MSTYKDGQNESAWYGDSVWSYDYPQNLWRETVQNSRPPARYGHQADFFTNSGVMAVFGGNGGQVFLDDTWLFDVTQNSWQRVNMRQAPTPRINAATTYDSANQLAILFGGLEEDMTDMGDTWVLSVSGTNGEWQKVEP